MDRDAGALAGGVEPFERGLAGQVGIDAAHVVVGAGPHRDRLVDGVDAGEDHGELAGAVQALDDLVRAQVAQVEEHVAVHAAALVDLDLLRARDDVAASQLHRVGRVVLQEALALRVEEIGALASAALGDEHARRRERRRVELHHLHVLQGHAQAQRHRHPVPGAGVGVRGARVEPSGAARAEDHRLRADELEPAVQEVPADDALAAPVVLDELPGEPLLVRRNVALHHLLVEHVDEHVAGDVGGVRGARLAGGAEGALRDAAVLGPREDRAPVLELVDVAWSLVAEGLDGVLVAEVVGALDRVEGVLLGVVLGGVSERCVDAALGRAGVAPSGMDLGDDGDVGARVERLDGGAHARAAGADDEDVVLRFHRQGSYTKRLVERVRAGGPPGGPPRRRPRSARSSRGTSPPALAPCAS